MEDLHKIYSEYFQRVFNDNGIVYIPEPCIDDGKTPDFVLNKTVVFEITSLLTDQLVERGNYSASTDEFREDDCSAPTSPSIEIESTSSRPLVAKIRQEIKKKREKYGAIVKRLSQPLVVAICADKSLLIDFFDDNYFVATSAIIGDLKVGFPDGFEPPMHYAQNGSFTRKQGGNPIGTSISAIVFCQRKKDNTYMSRIIHNPRAKNPLAEDLFHTIPQLVRVDETQNEIVMMWKSVI